MGKITDKQFRDALLKNDPQLIKFSKDPQAVLLAKLNLKIDKKQSNAIKSLMAKVNNVGASFGFGDAKKANGTLEDWLEIVEILIKLLRALIKLGIL